MTNLLAEFLQQKEPSDMTTATSPEDLQHAAGFTQQQNLAADTQIGAQQTAVKTDAAGSTTTTSTTVAASLPPSLSNGTHAMVGLGSYGFAGMIVELLFNWPLSFLAYTIPDKDEVALTVIVGLVLHIAIIKKLIPQGLE